MSAKQHTFARIAQCTVMIGIAGFCLAPVCLAGQAGRTTPTIRTITPVTELDISHAHIRAEDNFDIVGRLNLIESSQVIIGNRKLTIEPGLNMSGIGKYNLVGAILNNHGVVVALQKISDEPN
jgi:hypothetical protein